MLTDLQAIKKTKLKQNEKAKLNELEKPVFTKEDKFEKLRKALRMSILKTMGGEKPDGKTPVTVISSEVQ